MNKSIFRQKSINKINSPESLNDYVKVTNPSVWIILFGVLILIIGAFVFGTGCVINTDVNVAVEVTKGKTTAYIDENEVEKITSNMKVKIKGVEYSIESIGERAVRADELDEFLLHKSGMEQAQWLYPIHVDGTLEDGVYAGTITVEQVSPITYVFN